MPKLASTTAEKPKRVSRRKKAAPVTSDQIAHRAYELWLEDREGDDLAHWLMAEEELVGRAA